MNGSRNGFGVEELISLREETLSRLQTENAKLKHQLQSYKTKEDKLRDKLEKSLDSYDPIENKDDLIRYWCVTDILQILNEGEIE